MQAKRRVVAKIVKTEVEDIVKAFFFCFPEGETLPGSSLPGFEAKSALPNRIYGHENGFWRYPAWPLIAPEC